MSDTLIRETSARDPLLGRDPGGPGGEREPGERPANGALPGPGDLADQPGDPGGWRWPDSRETAPPAERGGAAPAVECPLVLPRLSPEIPEVLTLRASEAGARALAEAMLAAGILKESDWVGTVVRSIAQGLTRWTAEQLGDRALEKVNLGVLYTDDLEAVTNMDPGLWLEMDESRRPDLPVGLVGLVGDGEAGTCELFLGKRILELEALRPRLGLAVLTLLHEVLTWTCNAATPIYGYEQALKRHAFVTRGFRFTAEELERGNVLTPGRYRQAVPAAACEKLDEYPRVIRSAQGMPAPAHLREILRAAGDLEHRWHRIRKGAKVDDTALFALTGRTLMFGNLGSPAKEVYFALRWSWDDAIARIVDDYHHEVWSRGIGTNLLWCQAWQAADPAVLRAAVWNWRDILSLGLRGCRLAELLHVDDAPPPVEPPQDLEAHARALVAAAGLPPEALKEAFLIGPGYAYAGEALPEEARAEVARLSALLAGGEDPGGEYAVGREAVVKACHLAGAAVLVGELPPGVAAEGKEGSDAADA